MQCWITSFLILPERDTRRTFWGSQVRITRQIFSVLARMWRAYTKHGGKLLNVPWTPSYKSSSTTSFSKITNSCFSVSVSWFFSLQWSQLYLSCRRLKQVAGCSSPSLSVLRRQHCGNWKNFQWYWISKRGDVRQWITVWLCGVLSLYCGTRKLLSISSSPCYP
jgi:hypothetical protein